MKCTIRRFEPHATSLTVATVFALASVLFLAPMALAVLIMPHDGSLDGSMFGPSLLFFIFAPLFYFVFGYLATRVGIWIYNKVNGATGGIRITLETETPSSLG